MRRQHLTQLIGTMAVATALVGLPTAAFAVIAAGPHDLSTELSTPDSQTCIVCHTPHDAADVGTFAPLWNHEVTAVALYTLYGSDTLNAAPTQPSGVSKLCLSCHDGTVAIDNYGGNLAGAKYIDGVGGDFADVVAFGADLSNDHPISFIYDAALVTADGGTGLESPDADSGLGGSIDEDLLFAGSLECSSCHDVHDAASAGAAGHLLVMSNSDSDLCLTCHIK